jgi:hypothetical protein
MGVFSTNLSEIGAGALISASHISDLYNVLTGNIREDVTVSGSITVIGDLTATLTGTATTASYVENAVSASNSILAETASFYNGNEVSSISASFNYINISDVFIANGSIFFYTASLPTSDPGVLNQIWRSGSYLMISTGSGS